MKIQRFRAALAMAAALSVGAVFAPTAFAADVGVSVQVGQPGFYGRIDIGNAPPPVLVYPQPIIVQPAPVAMVRQPIYLHVPPGQAKNWARYCHRYAACGQPVYFVQDRWYRDVYVPRYRSAPPGPRYEAHERTRHYDGRPRGNPGRGHDPRHGRGHGPGRG